MTPASSDDVIVIGMAIIFTIGVGVYLILNELDSIDRKLDEMRKDKKTDGRHLPG